MRLTLSLIAMLAATFAASAQLVWDKTEYDFGMIKEADGPKKGHVKFVNKGSEDVELLRVTSSCGCTSVEYPDKPIAPGDSALLTFTYDPTGRPGHFSKTIRVKYTGPDGLQIIRITGNVLGTPQSLSRIYPDEAGPIRLTGKMVYGGELRHGKSRNDLMTVYNQSADSVTLGFETKDPTLSIQSTDLRVGPGETATFSLLYNSLGDDRYGPFDIPFTVIADAGGKNPSRAECSYYLSVIPDFSNLSGEAVANAPRIGFDPDRINAGEVANDVEKQPFSLTVTNTGKSQLKLLRVYSVYPEVILTDIPEDVKPGKSAVIKGEIDMTKVPAGIFQTKMRILSNDPAQPVTDMNIFGMKN